MQSDPHAAAGALEAEKSQLKAIVGKYNVSDADLNGEAGQCSRRQLRLGFCMIIACCAWHRLAGWATSSLHAVPLTARKPGEYILRGTFDP